MRRSIASQRGRSFSVTNGAPEVSTERNVPFVTMLLNNLRVPRPALGLDFGTTNSALALSDGEGPPRLARFAGPDERGRRPSARCSTSTARTSDEPGRGRTPARRRSSRYLEREVHGGRLIQSLKSFLASRLFSATEIFGHELPARAADRDARSAALREEAEAALGVPVHRAVVGRPVRFVGAAERRRTRRSRSRACAPALANAGFRERALRVRADRRRAPLRARARARRAAPDRRLRRRHQRLLAAARRPRPRARRRRALDPRQRRRGRRGRRLRRQDRAPLVAPLLGRGAEFVSFFGRRLPVPELDLRPPRALAPRLDAEVAPHAPAPARPAPRGASSPSSSTGCCASSRTTSASCSTAPSSRPSARSRSAPAARFRFEHDVLADRRRGDAAATSRPGSRPSCAAIAGCVDGLLARAGRRARRGGPRVPDRRLVPRPGGAPDLRGALRRGAHPDRRRVHLGRLGARAVRGESDRNPDRNRASSMRTCSQSRLHTATPGGLLLRSPRSQAPSATRVSTTTPPSGGSSPAARSPVSCRADLADHALVEHAGALRAPLARSRSSARATRARNALARLPARVLEALRRRPASPRSSTGSRAWISSRVRPSHCPKWISRRSGSSRTGRAARDDAGGDPRAAQVAREPEVHAPRGELRRDARHLRAALGRELDVGAAEVADARRAVGLAVADEQDLTQGHGGSPTRAGRPGAPRIGDGAGARQSRAPRAADVPLDSAPLRGLRQWGGEG